MGNYDKGLVSVMIFGYRIHISLAYWFSLIVPSIFSWIIQYDLFMMFNWWSLFFLFSLCYDQKLDFFSLVPIIESIIILRFQKTKWVRKNKLISNKNGCQCLGYLTGWNHTIHGLNLVVLHAISHTNYSIKAYLL